MSQTKKDHMCTKFTRTGKSREAESRLVVVRR